MNLSYNLLIYYGLTRYITVMLVIVCFVKKFKIRHGRKMIVRGTRIYSRIQGDFHVCNEYLIFIEFG